MDDKSILTKINTYSHANQIVDSWYEDKWSNWDETTGNLDPTDPVCSTHTIIRPLPEELVNHLTKYKFNEPYSGSI